MTRFKYPIKYELTPGVLEKGTQWMTLRLKNEGSEVLSDLNINMHSIDSFHISLHDSSNYINRLNQHEERTLNFQVDAKSTSHLYIAIRGKQSKDNKDHHFFRDSPWIQVEVSGEVAELESILVSNPYGIIGRKLEAEAFIKGLGNSEGLTLEFWADSPTGKYEELAKIKTKKLSHGEEASYTAEITPKEEGFYTVYANLYDDGRRIDRDSDVLFVEKY
jgi:hypothetical protein